MAQGLEIYKK